MVRKATALTVMWSQVRRMGNFRSKDSDSPMAFRKGFLKTVLEEIVERRLISSWIFFNWLVMK